MLYKWSRRGGSREYSIWGDRVRSAILRLLDLVAGFRYTLVGDNTSPNRSCFRRLCLRLHLDLFQKKIVGSFATLQ